MTTATPPSESPIGFAPEIGQLGALPLPDAGSRSTDAPRPRDHTAVARLGSLLRGSNWARLLLMLDAVALYVAAGIATLAVPHRLGSADRITALVFPLLVLALIHFRHGPDRRMFGSTLDTTFALVGTVSFATVLTVAGSATFGASHPVGETTRLFFFSVLLLTTYRLGLALVRSWVLSHNSVGVPTLIVGAGTIGERLAERLIRERRYGLRPVGFLDAQPQMAGDHHLAEALPILGGPGDLAAAVEATGARRVILAFTNEPDHLLNEQVRECERLGVDLSLVPRLYESLGVRATMDHVGALPLVSLRPVNPKGWQFMVKHGIGRFTAAFACLLLAPVLLLIAAAVRLSSPGPVLFRQRRVGRDGYEFDLLKFRSMRVATPSARDFVPVTGAAPGGVEGQDRRTRIGRLLRASSLDELPQLINVLRGDMTLVGPRPERPEYVRQFSDEVERYDDRHRVKSGITGWAQVNGLRGQTSIADRVECDNFYIRNWSLQFDLKIVALTVVEVFRFRDA